MGTVSGKSRSRFARPARLVLAAGALLTIAACTTAYDRSAISYAEVESPYSPSEVSYAADGRDFAVVVRGNPFARHGVSEATLGKAVVEAMAGQPGWFVTNYTTAPGESSRDLYRVTWAFGVSPNTLVRGLCEYGADSPPIPEDRRGDYMMAAFCRGDYPLSYLGGPMGDIETVDDPRFRNLVVVATRSLLPFREPNRDGRSRPNLNN